MLLRSAYDITSLVRLRPFGPEFMLSRVEALTMTLAKLLGV